jgi:hypothetical protein
MPEYETKEKFIEFLEKKFIPKLKNQGFVFTATEFEEAIYWLREGGQDTQERAA